MCVNVRLYYSAQSPADWLVGLNLPPSGTPGAATPPQTCIDMVQPRLNTMQFISEIAFDKREQGECSAQEMQCAENAVHREVIACCRLQEVHIRTHMIEIREENSQTDGNGRCVSETVLTPSWEFPKPISSIRRGEKSPAHLKSPTPKKI